VHDGYTHHPLGMHLHNTLAVWLFGDHEGSIRAVPAFFGVLALIALMMVVRLLYDDRTALFAGLVFVLAIGVVLAPVLHRAMHRFHLDGKA